jgi:phosphoglycolate phosphatase-like HAD superfamily hydrolase
VDRIGAIILDFDGVLIESNDEKMRAFQDLFALYPAHQDAMLRYHMENYSKPRNVKFEHCVYNIMRRPGDEEAVEAMSRRFSELVMQRVMTCAEVPGMRAFLEEFSKIVPLYISSVTPQKELHQVVEGRKMASFFSGIFGDPPTKKSDAIRTVLHRERLRPHEVVFVGDSVSDYDVATESGVQFVGRDSGLAFGGIHIELHGDLHEIANLLRERLKG